jgi:hypothetical protein
VRKPAVPGSYIKQDQRSGCAWTRGPLDTLVNPSDILVDLSETQVDPSDTLVNPSDTLGPLETLKSRKG